ncbi:5-formyltetrahydrofolate cyclo-ligase [Streptococcus oriscaviae]|uniref:5-formyltetrahydrofolate cyclo-ligase n=1 Tax=Streptococcus oriscaviae TaxID=2781599 RepID=A0ABX7YJ02_9STRE|nr:5-formyltetrahydrofolate cyclo-ligase [Streptococcus oriscaviae]QUE53740.1 5-formyltetrahydrofolate cyclo-ligase [Streptococcus oriscaviae]
MSKKELRKLMLTKLKAMSCTDRQAWSVWGSQQLFQTAYYQQAKTVATFLSLPHEFDTQMLIDQAQKDGKRLLVPKTDGKRDMIFVEYDPEQLVQSTFGIWEPISSEAVPASEIDLIQVPGLVWNPARYRIGYGGGYYDRYLKTYQGKTVSILCSWQEADFQEEAFDCAVEEVIIYEDLDG